MPENTEVEAKTPKKSVVDLLWAFFLRARGFTRLSLYKFGHIEKANMELGIKQLKNGDFADAAFRFKFVLWLNKSNVIAWYLLGKSYFYRQKFAEAIKPLQQALTMQPDLEEARFLLACCGANAEIKSIPRSFIIDKLDYVANHYEQFVANTSSRLNAVLEEELKKIIGDNMGFNVLDLGCRGGDTAQILRSKANALVGVEPSLKLIAIARNRRINDLLTFNLISGKFPEDYLHDCKERFSVVISTYYLDNLGSLDAYFAAIANVLDKNGIFAFNINLLTAPEDYHFKASTMMFAHSAAYINKLAAKNGFKIIVQREVKYASDSIDLAYITEKQ